jgi:multiple sugar transport system substrate-binding protein
MIKKNLQFVLAAVLIAVFLLAACAQQPAEQPAAPAATEAPAAMEEVTIRWRTRPDNQQEQDVYQKISDELSAQLASQGIKLQYDPAPVTGYLDKLTTEFSAGNAPDVVWIPGASTADYANLGVIADLMPYVNADPDFKISDYYDAPMN